METQTPSQEKKKDFNIDLKSLEVPIEKYPMAESKNMFESFLIIGYDDLYYQEKILKLVMKMDFNSIEVKDKKLKEEIQYYKVHCRNLPTILNSITSDFSGPILNGNKIIENVFPIPPDILVEIENKENENKGISLEKKNNYVIFSNIQNEVVNYGFGYIFYEKKIHESYKIYLPKAFVIISQYPLFNIFNKLCEEIKELFISNQQLQIPIEIQIYNIINFVPASIDTGLKMTLIPKLELSQIKALKNQDEFFLLETQEKYYPAQLNGYRSTEINFCYLFNILSVELILEIYLNLICGRIIGFFHNNISELSIILHIFHQFLFPFAPNENVSCLSPIKFFCDDTVDQNIVGFLCNYEDLEKYDPFREIEKGEFRCLTDEEENIDLDELHFKCDYILDLKNREFKDPDKYTSFEDDDNRENKKMLREYIKKLFAKFTKKSIESTFESIMYKLYYSLKDLLLRLTSNKKMKKIIFSPFALEDIRNTNNSILESFLQFNLNLAHLYYQKVSGYNGDYNISKEDQVNISLKSKEESGLSNEEYIIFKCFGNSLFGNCLDNFVGGYSSKEPKIYKASKLIFENLIYTLKLKKLYNFQEQNLINILDLYDEIYTNKLKDFNKKDNNEDKILTTDNKNNLNNVLLGKDKSLHYNKPFANQIALKFADTIINEEETIKNINHRTFTFFEFYKYYFSSNDIEQYFYNIANPEFVTGKIVKKSNSKNKYFFNYKKIALDRNILFKYIYKLKQMNEEIRKKCFIDIIQTEIIKKEPIRSYDNFISSALEKYYIKNKLIDNIELLNFSILGILILTVSKHNLIYYSEAINQIIKNIVFLTRKFVKIILSVCLRIFTKEKEQNLFLYEKYFDIYKTAIENKKIFPNDELKILQKIFNKFRYSIKSKKDINVNMLNELNENKNKKYSLDYNKKVLKTINFLELTLEEESYNKEKKKLIDIKLKFKYKKMKIEYSNVYFIPKLYEKICNFINEFYKDLDYNIILKEKNEFNKIIIFLLFYVEVVKEMKNDKKNKDKNISMFPEDIKDFLVNCLET